MANTPINIKDEKTEKIIRDAKREAFDRKISFSEVVVKLLEKWLEGSIDIQKGDKK